MIFVNKRVFALLAVLTLAACTRAPAGLHLPEGDLTIARAGGPALSLHVQIAETAASQERGLMGVKKMSDQVGMAFLFDAPTLGPFWMKDTLIPLDIAFWDAQGRVVDTFTMTPCKADPCHQYQPAASYVGSVEMNAGLLAAKGIRVGDTVKLKR